MTPRVLCAAALLAATPALAQFNPAANQWGKDDPDHVRVMTWNIQDAICRTNNKNGDDWDAIARIIAALKPDIIIFQECGDNSGNGSGSGLDSVSQLETVVDLLFNGGSDPFLGGSVADYVQLYAPGYTLPNVFVSTAQDGFNRNVLVSRWAFSDINGDTKAEYSDTPFIFPDLGWSVGGTGGIRGFMFAEIDLPDGTYAGDLVVGNGHLKAGGTSSDYQQREDAARNVSYYIHYWYNGAGTGTPDPNSKINDNPQPTQILDANTPVVWGGDWNQDDPVGGTYGPRDWMAQGPSLGGTDGTDRDLTDSTSDSSSDFFSGNTDTRGSSKLDYIVWHDSIATAQHQFIFNASTVGSNIPPELVGFSPNPLLASGAASDHLPVIIDFALPVSVSPPGAFTLSSPTGTGTPLEPTLQWTASTGAADYDVTLATDAGLAGVVFSQTGLAGTSVAVPAGLLETCATYYWGVVANNAGGSTDSTPYPASFDTVLFADITTQGAGAGDPDYGVPDGQITAADLNYFVNAYLAGDLAVADVTTQGAGAGDPNYGVPDGQITAADLNFYVNAWVGTGCP